MDKLERMKLYPYYCVYKAIKSGGCPNKYCIITARYGHERCATRAEMFDLFNKRLSEFVATSDGTNNFV